MFREANETLSFRQVKKVKRKHRKAYVLLIDGTTSEKKKGYRRVLLPSAPSVSFGR